MTRLLRIAVAPTIIVLLGGFSSFALPRREACPAQCVEWYEYIYNSYVHYVSDVGTDPAANGWFCDPYGCHLKEAYGECRDNHYTCHIALSDIPVERFASVVSQMQGAELRAALGLDAEKLRVNAARGVLQLTGCGERVIAQVALSPDQLAALAE